MATPEQLAAWNALDEWQQLAYELYQGGIEGFIAGQGWISPETGLVEWGVGVPSTQGVILPDILRYEEQTITPMGEMGSTPLPAPGEYRPSIIESTKTFFTPITPPSTGPTPAARGGGSLEDCATAHVPPTPAPGGTLAQPWALPASGISALPLILLFLIAFRKPNKNRR